MSEEMSEGMNDLFETALFAFPPNDEPHLLNPIVLAYVGDAIYEMFVRQYLVAQGNHRPHHLHASASQLVSAKAQAQALQRWYPELTEEELAIIKRGRNAKSGTVAKHVDVLDYRHSTAFECLLGYLFYKQQFKRLQYLMNKAIEQQR